MGTKRYQVLADKFTAMIREGSLLGGDKLPSVREASRQFSVSPSTVFKAYYQLEDRGLIRARQRSGYYVSENIGTVLPEPSRSKPQLVSSEVSINELVFSVLDSIRATATVPLGTAFPSHELFPLDQLSNSLAKANRSAKFIDTAVNVAPGYKALRRMIAVRYRTVGIDVSADDIIITNGAMEGLTLALQAVTRPGDTVAIESPGFYAALQTIERLHLKAIEIPMHPQDGADLDALAKMLKTQQIKACWLMSNFQNPLGSSMPDVNKQALVGLLGQYDIPLIEDDVYGELYFGKHYQAPLKTYDKKGLVIHCSSFSKTLAPTYRVGWTLAGRYYEKIRRAKLMTTLSTALPVQMALADYLNRGSYDKHLRQLRQLLEDQQRQMAASIAEHFPAGTKVSRPQGGYFLWVEFPSGIDALTLYKLALERDILIAPGPIFSINGDYQHCIRLNYGQPMGRVAEAVKVIGELAHGLL